MDESEHNKYNSLMRLAEFQGKRLDERRNHSWKISLAFWASILGSIALIENILTQVNYKWIVALGIGALMLHYYWLIKVFKADKRDKVTAFLARDEAMIDGTL